MKSAGVGGVPPIGGNDVPVFAENLKFPLLSNTVIASCDAFNTILLLAEYILLIYRSHCLGVDSARRGVSRAGWRAPASDRRGGC